jgi:hypothetical protein
MESLLNCLWVLIAASVLGVWRFCWVRERCVSRRHALEEWTAFACGLILLFFAVSLTDDLHSDFVLFDEFSSGRRHATVCDSARLPLDRPKILSAANAAILPRLYSSNPLGVIEAVVPTETLANFVLDSVSPSERAPPA